MHRRALYLSGLVLLLAVPAFAQQGSRPYTEAGVTNVQFIRVKSGHFEEYMAFLAGPYKQLMEAEKKAGVITGWTVYESDNRDENDWNIALVVNYKNMAALDNLRDRVDPIDRQVYGSTEKSSEAMVKRSEMRDIVGNRLMRRLDMK
jgi:hypothetical protein